MIVLSTLHLWDSESEDSQLKMSDSAWTESLHRVPARHKQGFIWTVNYARSLRHEWRKNNVILARSFNHAQWNMMPFISMWQIWALVCIYIINVASAMSTSGAPNFQPPWPLTTPWTVMSGQMFVALTLRSNLARALCSCVAVFVFNYPSNNLHHSNLCSSSMLSETSWRLCEAFISIYTTWHHNLLIFPLTAHQSANEGTICSRIPRIYQQPEASLPQLLLWKQTGSCSRCGLLQRDWMKYSQTFVDWFITPEGSVCLSGLVLTSWCCTFSKQQALWAGWLNPLISHCARV